MIFSMVLGTSPHSSYTTSVPTGAAMIAGAGLSTTSYRRHFDISVPLFHDRYEHARISDARFAQLLVGSVLHVLEPVDYRCEETDDDRFLMSTSCVTIPKLNSLSRSETGINLGI
jgi:hypothetical protein